MSGIAGKSNGIREGNHCKVNYIYSGRKRDTHRSIMDVETIVAILAFWAERNFLSITRYKRKDELKKWKRITQEAA